MLKTVSSVINAIGALNYKGTWNASTNTPTLTSGVGTKGDYYVVSVAGNTNLDGETLWGVGDWAVFNGSVWQKVDGGSTGDFTNITVNGTANIATANVTNFSSGNVSITGGSISNTAISVDNLTVDYIQFDANATVTDVEGRLYWNDDDNAKTLNLVMEGADVVQQVGEEIFYRIKASSAITNGQVVMFTGSVGASGGLTGAPATGLTASTASYVMGVATEDIANNAWGYVTSFGVVRGLNTTGGAEAWVDGQILYYDPSVAGGLTKTPPTAPNAKIQVCAVIHAAASQGSLAVRPTYGGRLGQFEGDVEINGEATNDFLIYDTNRWENANVSVVQTTLGLGSMAYQNSSNVTITGGSINVSNTNTVATTSSTATFATAALPLEPEGYITINVNGIAKKVPYYGV